MAKATAICKCDTCGEEFVKEKICRNRADADNWEMWAKNNCKECPDCFRKRLAAERENKASEIKAKYNLPEIEGGSEKQANYANMLRDRYVAEHSTAFEVAKEIADVPVEEVEKAAIENGMTVEAVINENLEYYGATKAYKLMTMSKASEIIDLLR